MKYVPTVKITRRRDYADITVRMNDYDFTPFLTSDVVGCAKSLMAIPAMQTNDEVLAIPRSLLSDALRDAGCEDPEVHDAIDGWASTISQRIIDQHAAQTRQ